MVAMQGAGQSSFVTAWGDGFVTDPTILSANGLSDPRPFFDTLATKPYLDRVSPTPTASAGEAPPHCCDLEWMVSTSACEREDKVCRTCLLQPVLSGLQCPCCSAPAMVHTVAVSSGSAACTHYWPCGCSSRTCRAAL